MEDTNPNDTPPVAENATISLDAKDTRVLRTALRAAARGCTWQARLSMAMVVFSIVSCIAVLLLGDRVEDLFMSDIKRRALRRAEEAKYKLLEKFASLDDRAIVDMDMVYSQLRREYGLSILNPNPDESPLSDSIGSADAAKPSTPPLDLAQPPAEPSEFVDPKTLNISVEEYERMKAQILGLQTERKSLSTKLDNVTGLTDERLREENADMKALVQRLEKESSAKDAKISAGDTARDSLWKAREEQNQKIGQLNEKLSNAAMMEEVRSMVSSVFIRGGALLLLIWLVKIFVRKHQHAVNGREFYNAALNALQIKGVRSFAQFKEAISVLRHDHFELRDADLELLSEKLQERVANLIKVGGK